MDSTKVQARHRQLGWMSHQGKPSLKSVWRTPGLGLFSKQPLLDSVQRAAIEIRSKPKKRMDQCLYRSFWMLSAYGIIDSFAPRAAHIAWCVVLDSGSAQMMILKMAPWVLTLNKVAL